MNPVDDTGPLPDSETVTFVLRLRPGHEDEYRRRHDELWPDMRAALLAQGILHYEIHLHRATGMLFAFLVRRRDHSMNRAGQHEVLARWRLHMSDILLEENEKPVREPLERMFALRAD